MFFQKLRYHCSSFNPDKELVWYYNSPVGKSIIANVLKEMSEKAGMVPFLTNHCSRDTSLTVLPNANCEFRHIKFATGHKSDETIKSYNYHASFRQQHRISYKLSGFLTSNDQEEGNPGVSATLRQKTIQYPVILLQSIYSKYELQLQSWYSTTDYPWKTTVRHLLDHYPLRSCSRSASCTVGCTVGCWLLRTTLLLQTYARLLRW